MESLSAALPVAGHAGSAGSLALPAVVLADVTGLAKQRRRREQKMKEQKMKEQKMCQLLLLFITGAVLSRTRTKFTQILALLVHSYYLATKVNCCDCSRGKIKGSLICGQPV